MTANEHIPSFGAQAGTASKWEVEMYRALEAERDLLRERERELVEALRGVLSIEDTVTQGQESERRAEWLPKARAVLAKHGG